jgi:hypothetical protein
MDEKLKIRNAAKIGDDASIEFQYCALQKLITLFTMRAVDFRPQDITT